MILLVSLLPAKEVTAQSTSFTFKPVADAYVNQSSPASNYGTSASLLVDNSPYAHSYLRFSVTGLNGSPVQSAKLRLYAKSSNSTGITVNQLANNTWGETAITFSNAPAAGSAIKVSGAVSTGAWLELDVTSYVKAGGTYNLELATTSATQTSLASRESGGNAPQLIVTTSSGTQATPTPQPGPTKTPTIAPTQTGGSKDPIIFFTSDLVSGSSVARAQKVVDEIKTLMGQHAGTKMLVASVGDNEQENNPTVANYQAYFGPTYGTFVNQGIFMQVRGNHDIQSVGSYTDYNGTVHSSGAAYWDYFGANAHLVNIAGQKLTDYSYNLGNWHIIALDQLSGSGLNKATLGFLNSDLAAHTSQTCQIVYWHVPTYSSGVKHGDATVLKPLNQAEFNYGVDIQLNGHDHDYQRFYPIDPNGVRNNAKGITTFIDGIGGQAGRAGAKTSIAQAASALYMDAFPGGDAIGVVQFTLHPTSADFALYDANTGAILDKGNIPCH
jgi:hypothetical protein